MVRVIEPHRIEDGTPLHAQLRVAPFLDSTDNVQPEPLRPRLARPYQFKVALCRWLRGQKFVSTRTYGLLRE